MPELGDLVVYFDPSGVKHNALLGGFADPLVDHIHVCYWDDNAPKHVFGTSHWQDYVVRVLSVRPITDPGVDSAAPANCWQEAPAI